MQGVYLQWLTPLGWVAGFSSRSSLISDIFTSTSISVLSYYCSSNQHSSREQPEAEFRKNKQQRNRLKQVGNSDRLPCWPSRGQQVSHQRWILGKRKCLSPISWGIWTFKQLTTHLDSDWRRYLFIVKLATDYTNVLDLGWPWVIEKVTLYQNTTVIIMDKRNF